MGNSRPGFGVFTESGDYKFSRPRRVSGRCVEMLAINIRLWPWPPGRMGGASNCQLDFCFQTKAMSTKCVSGTLYPSEMPQSSQIGATCERGAQTVSCQGGGLRVHQKTHVEGAGIRKTHAVQQLRWRDQAVMLVRENEGRSVQSGHGAVCPGRTC